MSDDNSVADPTGLAIVRDPTIYLVGKQVIAEGGMADFLRDHGLEWSPDTEVPAQLIAEAAGRVCYMSFGKGRGTNEDYLGNILSSGHGSVLEHAVWNFIITGVSRTFTHELIRHRAGFGYSQLSQRYVNESKAEFIEPDVIAEDPESHAIWVAAIGEAQGAYRELAKRLRKRFAHIENRTQRRKLARQAARSVLPNATETKIFVTGNVRAWRHFIEMRGAVFADWEIRRLAIRVLEILQREAPLMFGDFTVSDLPDGTRTATPVYSKI